MKGATDGCVKIVNSSDRNEMVYLPLSLKRPTARSGLHTFSTIVFPLTMYKVRVPSVTSVARLLFHS